MGLDVSLWSDVQINVQSALATALDITAISKANPGVVSYTGTDPVNGDVVLLRVDGMPDADYLLARVASLDGTGNTFALEGIDTTNFSGTFSSGTAEKVTFGVTAATVTDVSPSGGEAEDVAVRTVHTSQDKSIPGNSSPLVYQLGNYWDPDDPALLALKAFARTKTPAAIAIIFAGGQKVYMAATPSMSYAPGGSAGAAVTTPVKLNVRGPLTQYAS